jgi:starch synthase
VAACLSAVTLFPAFSVTTSYARYVFDGIGEGDLNSALDRALQHYKERPKDWDDVTSKVMRIDNSWNKSAGQYVELYSGIRA